MTESLNDSRVDERPATADTAVGRVFTPSAAPAAAVIGALTGVALLVLCAIAVRDLVVQAGWLDSDEWLLGAADWTADISWHEWMWPAAIAALIVGLAMLWAAVKPRRHTHIRMADHEVIWTRRVDVARRISAAVSDLSGVDHATTVVKRRKVTCRVIGRESVIDRARVQQTVESVIDNVAISPRAVVRIASSHGGRTKGDRAK